MINRPELIYVEWIFNVSRTFRILYKKIILAIVLMTLGLTLLTLSNYSFAQCANSTTPSCNVYPACFAKYCPCIGQPDEYFLSYGLKYCTKFLENANFSEVGKKWRNSTLVCLQETIVPKLDISDSPICNCATMKSFAFESHVTCYTKPGASVCNLPISDVNELRKIIDNRDIFTSEGWKQMHEVTKICKKTAPDDGRRTLWRGLELILSLR